MVRRARRFTPGYVAVLAASFLIAIAAGWTGVASRMDRDAYDWMTRTHAMPGRTPGSVVLGFDERTLSTSGELRNIRTVLAAALDRILPANPAVVAIDVLLPDDRENEEDRKLADVLRRTPNLILGSDLIPGTPIWENPADSFRGFAKAVGHVHAAPDPVSRVLPLEMAGGRDRRWAMALEAARLKLGTTITESPEDLEIGPIRIPASRNDLVRAEDQGKDTRFGRALYIRYREGIPVISAAQLLENRQLAEQFRDKVVFVGLTAQTAARDRLMTPLDQTMSGVEIHAQAFETIVGREFLRPAPISLSAGLCLLFALLAGVIFAFLSGWRAYLAGAGLIFVAHMAPHIAFTSGMILPYLVTVFAAWLSAITAASWQYFVVRRQLQRSESDKQRYQEAIHFVTHEMRSPLTAIQGSSEMMGRYNLTDEKRKQMAQMINAESKRLAKMIQTFLDIERLTDGKTEIRHEPFDLDQVIESCADRARVLAARKNITVHTRASGSIVLSGDHELMEYAVYNLLTNAIKYSPADTEVTVSAQLDGDEARVVVVDQGMGMDEKELRNIGRKFYRTKKAEASGEAGTGIGLSLVQQIVSHHHGRMEVTSTPGEGSCFTMVLPAIKTPRTVSL